MKIGDIKTLVIPIIAGGLSAGVTLFLNLPIFVCLIATIAVWGGTAMIVSPDRMDILREMSDTPSGKLDFAREIGLYVEKKAGDIEDKDVCKSLLSIGDNIAKLVDTFTKNPEKLKNNNKIFDYYLPNTKLLIDKYDEIEDKGLTSKESKEYLEKSKQIILTLDLAYKEMLNKAYETDIFESSADIKVLNDVIKMEGLGNEKF